MSSFADGCRRQASAAWRGVGSFPASYSKWKTGPSAGQRAQRGCLGFLFFGVLYIFIPLMVFLAVEAVLVAWALLMSLIALIVIVTTDARALRRSRSEEPSDTPPT